MTNEEREELRAALEAAGCHKIGRVVASARWGMPGDKEFIAELRSLLRREDRLRVMEAGVRAGGQLLEHRTFDVNDPLALAMVAALKLLEAEVPDGQG